LLAGTAVLFKETGIVVPLLLFLSRPPGDGESRWKALAPAVVAAAVFSVSLTFTAVASSYWPSGPGLQAASRLWPPFALELAVPWFVPAGVPGVARDLLGLVLAVPAAAAFVRFGSGRASWRRGVAMAGVAILPVLHVLPNDGGQWYLLLPSLGIALAWGALAEDARLWRGVLVVVAVSTLFGLYEAVAWQRAAVRVDATIEGVRAAQMEAPPRQDLRDWPHRGPSFCCGVPYQVLDDPGRGWSGITESAPEAP
jgi:hypothetical protein